MQIAYMLTNILCLEAGALQNKPFLFIAENGQPAYLAIAISSGSSAGMGWRGGVFRPSPKLLMTAHTKFEIQHSEGPCVMKETCEVQKN